MTAPNFRDYLASDKEIFLNKEEFATPHTVKLDGYAPKEMPLVMASDQLNKRSLPYAEGVYISRLLFYVDAIEFERKPVEGQKIWVDNKQYFVANVTEDEGVYEITVEGNFA